MAIDWYMKNELGEMEMQAIFDELQSKTPKGCQLYEVERALREFMNALQEIRELRDDANTIDARRACLWALKKHCTERGMSEDDVELFWFTA